MPFYRAQGWESDSHQPRAAHDAVTHMFSLQQSLVTQVTVVQEAALTRAKLIAEKAQPTAPAPAADEPEEPQSLRRPPKSMIALLLPPDGRKGSPCGAYTLTRWRRPPGVLLEPGMALRAVTIIGARGRRERAAARGRGHRASSSRQHPGLRPKRVRWTPASTTAYARESDARRPRGRGRGDEDGEGCAPTSPPPWRVVLLYIAAVVSAIWFRRSPTSATPDYINPRRTPSRSSFRCDDMQVAERVAYR